MKSGAKVLEELLRLVECARTREVMEGGVPNGEKEWFRAWLISCCEGEPYIIDRGMVW